MRGALEASSQHPVDGCTPWETKPSSVSNIPKHTLVPLTHEKVIGHPCHVNSSVCKGVALVVVLTATFITIHPDFDLLDGVLHNNHDRMAHAPMVVATLEPADHLLLAIHRLLDSHTQRDKSGLVALDLLCVRLC